MNLISFQFIGFMILLFVCYHFFENLFYHKIILLSANILFYYFFIANDAILLIFMICGSYMICRFIPNHSNKKILMLIIVLLSCGILFYYKYSAFFYECVNTIFKTSFTLKKTIISPLGLSFYTFKILSYCIDVYHGKIEKLSFLDYCIYVSFFVQLASGPIERYENFSNSLNRRQRFDYELCRNGFILMMMGMFEKMVFSDNLAILVEKIFSMENAEGSTILVGIFLYSLNLYLDFDAYSNIAIGAAKCLMIETKPNFRTPYFAVSLKDFWDRWHISLSTWFQNYIYIPLGGSRKGTIRKYCNLIIVFLISGLWHGAALNFVLWGFLHGLLQVAEDLIRRCIRIRNKVILFVTHLFTRCWTFVLVSYLWLFFRIKDGAVALNLIQRSFLGWSDFHFDFSLLGYNEKEGQFFIALIGSFFIIELLRYRTDALKWFSDRSPIFRWIVYVSMIVIFVLFAAYGSEYDPNYFTYFEF